MKTIVTHPGQAHRDEFLSCCLLIAADKADRIERRDCTDEDLTNPEVIVLDQGGMYPSELMNFDHHQDPRDAAPRCSITLVLPYLDIDVEQARQIWTWLEFSELLDSKGPFETAKRLGSNPDALFAGVSPVETTVLRWFEEMAYIDLPEQGENALWGLMYRIGKEKLDYLKEVTARLDCLRENAKVVEVEGLRFVDATYIDRGDNPTMGLEVFCRELGGAAAGTITQDDRGDGLTLFRRKDHPRVDFSRLEGMDGVVFAHKGGFVAKLAAGVDPLPMVEAATVVKVVELTKPESLFGPDQAYKDRIEELTSLYLEWGKTLDPGKFTKMRIEPDELRPENEPTFKLDPRIPAVIRKYAETLKDEPEVDLPECGKTPQSSRGSGLHLDLASGIMNIEPETPLVLQRKQHVIDVRVVCNSEPVPGWGHDPQDMVKAAARGASQPLGAYDPIVISSEVKDLKVDELTDSETAAILRHMTKEEVS